MRIKVYGGTPDQGSESLCDTCRHSMITRGRRIEEQVVRCHAVGMETTVIPFVVTECTAYSDASQPSYHQLLDQAWILRPHSEKRPAGFVRAKDLPPKERENVMAHCPDEFLE